MADLRPGHYFTGPTLALIEAIDRDDAAAVAQACDTGAEPNTIGAEGLTPLLWACLNGRAVAAAALLHRGADPNLCGARGPAPLVVAVVNGDVPLCRAVLAAGADPDIAAPRDDPVLFIAARRRDWPVFDALVDHGADLNIRDALGQTPAIALTCLGAFDRVRALLERGADPFATDDGGVDVAWFLDDEMAFPPASRGSLRALRTRIAGARP